MWAVTTSTWETLNDPKTSSAGDPIMREQQHGRIVNIGSVVGFVPAPYQGIYAASKHAVEGYSEWLDREVPQFGIPVSVIEPGFTKTGITRNTQVVADLLNVYARMRSRVLETVHENIALRDAGTQSAARPHSSAA
jgi:short-subunit dehydrogenase